MTNDFNGYSLFNDISDPSIRAWNRATTVWNIKERHGDVVASRYASKFSKEDLNSIFTIMIDVAKNGHSEVRRTVFRDQPTGEYIH